MSGGWWGRLGADIVEAGNRGAIHTQDSLCVLLWDPVSNRIGCKAVTYRYINSMLWSGGRLQNIVAGNDAGAAAVQFTIKGTAQHSPAAPSPTAAEYPSAQMHPWECGHNLR